VHGLNPVLSGSWFVVRGLWFVVCGLWFVVCGLWFVVRGSWFVVCGSWFVVGCRLSVNSRGQCFLHMNAPNDGLVVAAVGAGRAKLLLSRIPAPLQKR